VNVVTEIAETTKITETGREIIDTIAAMAGTLHQIGILTEAIGVIGGPAQGTAQGRTETAQLQLADVQIT